MGFALVRRNCNNCNFFNAYRHLKVLVSGFSTKAVFELRSGFTLEI